MTYNVFGGTLNLAQSRSQTRPQLRGCSDTPSPLPLHTPLLPSAEYSVNIKRYICEKCSYTNIQTPQHRIITFTDRGVHRQPSDTHIHAQFLT